MARGLLPLTLLLAACEGYTIKFPSDDTAAPDTTGPDDTGDDSGADTDTLPDTHPFEGSRSMADADIVLYSPERGDGVGAKETLAAPGDLDGDGATDLVVAARVAPTEAGYAAGRVYVVSRPPLGTSDLDIAVARIDGDAEGGYFGYSVSAAGDVDGDGTPDFVVGSPGFGVSRAYVFRGPVREGEWLASDADTTLVSPTDADYAGSTVGAAGDLDGDGRDDVIVTAPQDGSGCSGCGAIYFSFAAGTDDGAALDTDSVRVYGDRTRGQVGYGRPTTADLDGDGSLDLAVGAPYSAAWGVAIVYGPHRSSSLGLSEADAWLAGSVNGSYAGVSLAAADLDGDGYTDLAIGAPYETEDRPTSGRVYVEFGSASRLDEAANVGAGAILHGSGSEAAGNSLSLAGDVDGDGSEDLLVGAPYNATLSVYGGAAYVVYGPLAVGSQDLADAPSFAGSSQSAMAGDAITGPADVDGDGQLDLAMGALYADQPGYGAIYVFLAP